MAIEIVAILYPAAGKIDRVLEIMTDTANWVKENEPGTLRYTLLKETKDDEPVVVVSEKYQDDEAIKKHMTGPKLAELGKLAVAEGLFTAPPKIMKLSEAAGFAR